MVIFVRKMLIALSIMVIILATSSISHAVPISGSLPLVGLTVSQNETNLSTSTMISADLTVVSSPGAGDFSPIPAITSYDPSTLDLTSLGTFTMSNLNYGSFVSQSADSFIVSQTADFLDVFLKGTYTPGPSLSPSLTANNGASLRFSVNQSGSSISEAITLDAPPARVDTPEPSAWIRLSTGTLVLFGYGLRRQYQV